MTKKTRLTIAFLSISVALLLTGGGLTFIFNKLLHLDTYKDQILVETQRLLKRQVLYEKGHFSFKFGPSFTFTEVMVKEPNSSENFITVKKLSFRVALLPLLEKRVSLREVTLEHPQINLSRDKTGTFNFNDLIKQSDSAVSVQLKGFNLVKGTVLFQDKAISPQGISTRLENVDLHLNNLARGKNCSLKLEASIGGQANNRLFAKGSIKLADAKSPLTGSEANVKIETDNLDAAHFWPYYMSYVPFKKVLGRFDMDLNIKGHLAAFSSKGQIKAAAVRFDYPQVFHAVLTPRNLHLQYALELNEKDISIKQINLTVDELNVKGSCAILDIHSKDPRIVARAATSHFKLENFSGYVPYGIIVDDTADFIEKHIKGGTYKLDEGRLDGRISQILHMEFGQNYNILFIKAKVDKGIVSFGSQVPVFNSVKGDLEMRGKDFNLIGMSGNFGSSPFTLNGKISDYPLTTPSAYPFAMKMTPRQAEIAWLLGKEQAKHLMFAGDTEFFLSGNGFTSGYNLSGDWNLTNAAYSFKNLIDKPVGKANKLSVKGNLNKQEANLTQLAYDLGPLHLAVSAGYRYKGPSPLDIRIQTNQFSAGDLAPMLPAVKQYYPTGKLKTSIHGTGSDFSKFNWDGNILFSNFSFKPPEPVKTLTNMSGTIHFRGEELETSQLSVRLGSSILYGKGSLKGFKNPTFNISFASPSLYMSDLGLKGPAERVQAEKLQGSVSLKEGTLKIKELSAQIKNSPLSIKGTVQDLDNPNIDIAVSSSNLDIEDLLLLAKLEATAKNNTSTKLKMRASIRATAGRFKDVEFKHLNAIALLEDKILYLQQMEFAAFGGEVSGKGRFDSGSNVTPRYQASFNLKGASAEKVTRAIGIKKQEITGTLSLQGELTVKGDTSAEIKRTALGSVKFKLEDGSLRRFPTLSKIFSILNVSQLLKLQLPDMVSGGMPYNRIAGSLSIHDGIISTKDLFLDGDAMNMSCVGKIDLPKEEIDATIGVQPLQTVDKVVSRIPIVGWILTGKNKTLVTAYFEAKGKVDDPKVEAIPVKYLTKGVFDIFRRVFELPAKLITDTGEVITGR